jgi:hypothetical protein
MNNILPSKQIKLSKIKNSRDPYEYKAFRYLGTEHDPLVGNAKFKDFMKSAQDLKLNSQYLCFTIPEKSIGHNIFYFTRWGYDRPKLWELYGDRHRGVCIGFDREKIISSFVKNRHVNVKGSISCKEVIYKDIVSRSDQLKNITLPDYYRKYRKFDLDLFLRDFEEPFFFQKDVDYKDENEYRFLLITDKEQVDEKFSIGDSILDIYYGDLVDTDYINYYYKIIRSEFPHVGLHKVNWFNGTAILKNFHDDESNVSPSK